MTQRMIFLIGLFLIFAIVSVFDLYRLFTNVFGVSNDVLGAVYAIFAPTLLAIIAFLIRPIQHRAESTLKWSGAQGCLNSAQQFLPADAMNGMEMIPAWGGIFRAIHDVSCHSMLFLGLSASGFAGQFSTLSQGGKGMRWK